MDQYNRANGDRILNPIFGLDIPNSFSNFKLRNKLWAMGIAEIDFLF